MLGWADTAKDPYPILALPPLPSFSWDASCPEARAACKVISPSPMPALQLQQLYHGEIRLYFYMGGTPLQGTDVFHQ